jgi:uncharacterized membrane protein
MKTCNSCGSIAQRPPSQVTATTVDMILELLALAALVLCFAIPLAALSRLPDTIPAHFNLRGEVDGYGSKRTILYPLPVAGVLYIALTILSRHPRIYNYAVEITEKNAQVQYRLATRLVRLLKLVAMLTFSFLEYLMVISAFGHHKTMAAISFGPVVLVVILGSLAYYICRSVKAK